MATPLSFSDDFTAEESLPEPTVFIVDDDSAVRDALVELIQSMDMKAHAYHSVNAFLKDYSPSKRGCLVLDVRLPQHSGIELQQHLNRHKITIPIIFVSGHSTVSIAVQTLKAGAIDFIEKPFNDQDLLDSIQRAMKIDKKSRNEQRWREKTSAYLNCLSKREKEVLRFLIQGKANKTIAHEMTLSIKTVETHRAHIMQKLEINSMAGMVWMALISGEYHEIPDRLPFNPPPDRPSPFSLQTDVSNRIN